MWQYSIRDGDLLCNLWGPSIWRCRALVQNIKNYEDGHDRAETQRRTLCAWLCVTTRVPHRQATWISALQMPQEFLDSCRVDGMDFLLDALRMGLHVLRPAQQVFPGSEMSLSLERGGREAAQPGTQRQPASCPSTPGCGLPPTLGLAVPLTCPSVRSAGG